jgi:hypothetical protein
MDKASCPVVVAGVRTISADPQIHCEYVVGEQLPTLGYQLNIIIICFTTHAACAYMLPGLILLLIAPCDLQVEQSDMQVRIGMTGISYPAESHLLQVGLFVQCPFCSAT